MPKDIETFDIKFSLTWNDQDCPYIVPVKSITPKMRNKPINWQDFIVFSKKDKVYVIWRILYVISCLISSYLFTWFAAFGPPASDTISYQLGIFFEVYFAFSIIFNFVTEYEIPG